VSVLSYYQRERTTIFASQYDQRFSYCLYVPRDYADDGDRRYPLVIAVHGTDRTVETYRDAFVDFCEDHGCVLLAPLFPSGIGEPGELNNYKFIEYRDIRFDQVLLGIVDEVASIWRVDAEKFLLHGFSGGAHFTHRFFYLHPDRLLAASIAAPGMVTLLDPTEPWWVGVRDFAERFRKPLDYDAMRAVAVQLVVGAADTDTWEITLSADDPRYLPGMAKQGRNRIDRLQALAKNYSENGISQQVDLVAGAGHELAPLLLPVKSFLSSVLRPT
jgi:predicted peptidase